MNQFYSGGARGADQLWGEYAYNAYHEVCHYSFEGHRAAKWATGVKLNQDQLNQADPYLLQANKYLKRSFPTGRPFVDNLLRRNWWIQKDVDSLYILGFRDPKTGGVAGGSAWSTTMFIHRHLSSPDNTLNQLVPIYFFEQATERWLGFNTSFGWITTAEKEIPSPTGKWGGIGSRDLLGSGVSAAARLFQLD